MEAPSSSDMLVSIYKYIECHNSYVSYGINKSDSTSAAGRDIFTATTVLVSPGPIQAIHNSHRNIKSPKREAGPLPPFTFDLTMSKISLHAPGCKPNMGTGTILYLN
jgi:hypothetical protein